MSPERIENMLSRILSQIEGRDASLSVIESELKQLQQDVTEIKAKMVPHDAVDTMKKEITELQNMKASSVELNDIKLEFTRLSTQFKILWAVSGTLGLGLIGSLLKLFTA